MLKSIINNKQKMSKVAAFVCNSCSFGSKKDNCSKCGNWAPNNKHPAFLCGSCGFGSKKDNCVKCGK